LLDQRAQVFLALSERRDIELYALNSIIEVAAEAALGDLVLERP
jgi:hypothetical protein